MADDQGAPPVYRPPTWLWNAGEPWEREQLLALSFISEQLGHIAQLLRAALPGEEGTA